MIAVQIELWPFGSVEGRRIIAAAVIENRGLDESGIGYRYLAELHQTAEASLQIPALEQIVEISGFDREQSIWHLLHQVLSAALADAPGKKPATTLD